jgi:phosphatidate phosphatase APP1
LKTPLLKENQHQIKLELLDQVCNHKEKVVTFAEVLLLEKKDSAYGIVSDIDDTILVSHSTRFFKKLRLMLFKNAHTRLPFEGIAGFYRALERGPKGECHNPIFYVSSSQWNLYDLLSDFLEYRKIPKGLLLLQEYEPVKLKRLFKAKNAFDKHAHKLDKIRSIMETYPYLNFILIGDSGQRDAEIYREITAQFPGRILAIYIRDVRKSRVKKVLVLGNELNAKGIDMLLIKDTVLAARHALKAGFISSDCLADVVLEKEKDLQGKVEI